MKEQEDGSGIFAKLAGTTLTFRNAADDTDLTIGNISGPHTHQLAAGATDVTATAAELNTLDGITASTAELNCTDGVTSAIQTQLDGKAASGHTHQLSAGATDVTASKDEINVLDGIPATLTATELGYVDGVTSAIQTQLDSKATPITNQNNVSADRADNTPYQNTTGKVMDVMVYWTDSTTGRTGTAYSDSNSSPTTQVGKASSAGTGSACLPFKVIPGNYYKVDWAVVPTTILWMEYY
ncbi:MAG TPA: hypothetical protein VN368_00950 [Candidatus Methylomirabilis sp.]|nr:hypothetical protein [Candidatus Methylomirabilis sp.]